jgi:hypothetical protein
VPDREYRHAELRSNVVEAVTAYYFDHPRPERIRLHLVRDEVLSVAGRLKAAAG